MKIKLRILCVLTYYSSISHSNETSRFIYKINLTFIYLLLATFEMHTVSYNIIMEKIRQYTFRGFLSFMWIYYLNIRWILNVFTVICNTYWGPWKGRKHSFFKNVLPRAVTETIDLLLLLSSHLLIFIFTVWVYQIN